MSNDKTVAMFPGEDGHRRGTENSDKRRCMGCMELYDKKWELCPHCGYPANATADSLSICPRVRSSTDVTR